MQVREAMSPAVVSIGPGHTLRQAAALMSQRNVGAAVVIDPDSYGLGIMTERDILRAIGAGLDPDVERAESHHTSELVFAGPEWTLTDAADAMIRGGFRHLIVIEHDDVIGILSVRDIIRVWSKAAAELRPRAGARASS
ncbi:CBS domain-containing protein [Actinocatenispora rupis]|uniref:Histidine kinase n=1 Tax=Actinocatenispora rupis TaxID=519421 RepID=A0A8J3NBJ9_9ACTN|nr:CBS domain-containing protein [Actinocatenispora rupis]GID13146.1 histidine kinase [Actinocatenispora rupis]